METPEPDDMVCIEVKINSLHQIEKEQLTSPETSPQKLFKRMNHDASQGSPPKKIRRSHSDKELSSSTPKKHKQTSRNSKSKVHIDPAEVKNILEGMDDEIDNVLEETAQKNKLTATNVKNILRYVITNKDVLAMVRNTVKAENNEGDDLEEAPFEPKLTRSKVKELWEKQHMLPWPMSTPVKEVDPETKALLEEEFSDESSSDEDYRPNEDECPSEEDIAAGSPKSGNLNSSICEEPASSVTKPEEDADEDIGLVIALPEAENASVDNEVDKIALRTRSKLPLNDTPLEAIEASFIAPDITVDMYDTQCDDEEWQKFLRELSKPLDSIVAVEKPDEEPDDPEEDPEYNALEDDDAPDELDLRYDNSMKITRKEVNSLWAELYDESIFNDVNEEEEESEMPVRIDTPVSEVNDVQTERTGWWMTLEERLQLEHQMRMYVQILMQSYLLSFGHSELNFINISNKLFLDEIKMFASRSSAVNERSAFYAYNLDDALSIVNEYENNKHRFHVRSRRSKCEIPGITIPQVKKTMLNSKVFIYPELLPTCGFRKNAMKRAIFSAAEDNLIALGLEEFSFSSYPVFYIKSFLVPTKTEEQIKIRIKNMRSAKGAFEKNPINYYFMHKRAPSFPRVVELFDPDKVKAPKDQPLETLPLWMRQMFCPPVIQPIVAKPFRPFVPMHVPNCLPRRRLRKLLPRNVTTNNKNNRNQTDLKTSLSLLQTKLLEKDPKKEEKEALFVNSYLLRVTEALKEDPDTCEKFLNVLCKNQHSAQTPVKLYLEVKEILKDYPALANDFIAFLSPEQAKECGRYKEYAVLCKIRAFIQKVEVHFRNQPQQLCEVFRVFSQFRQQCSITSAEVISILQPLLKDQSHLMEELFSLLPEIASTENVYNSSSKEVQGSNEPDYHESKDCECKCDTLSTETESPNKINHCSKCEVKVSHHIKPLAVIQNSTVPSDQSVTSTSKLPCDIIEHTVFPAVSWNKKNAPNSKKLIRCTENVDVSPKKKSQPNNQTEIVSKTENQSPSISNQTIKWTRDEDKLIVHNCQKFGITKKAFEVSSSVLQSRTPEQVEERFVHLMNLLSQELNIQ